MSSDEIVALREQIDILEERQTTDSATRRAALNVIKRHDLMMEYTAELTLLEKLGDRSAIVYYQQRPIGGPVFRDCSSYELGETTWEDPYTGEHTGLRCLERHPKHPTMQCMKLRDHAPAFTGSETDIHRYMDRGSAPVFWSTKVKRA